MSRRGITGLPQGFLLVVLLTSIIHTIRRDAVPSQFANEHIKSTHSNQNLAQGARLLIPMRLLMLESGIPLEY
jgi:hypothetical protein